MVILDGSNMVLVWFYNVFYDLVIFSMGLDVVQDAFTWFHMIF